MDWIKVPFTKALTPDETRYLKSICDGLDKQIELIAEYLGSEEFAELQRMNQLQIDAFFQNSGIRDQLTQLIEFNAQDSSEFIENFYKQGAALGYENIRQVLAYTLADQEALFHLKNYNFELIKDINEELRGGIRTCIFDSVAAGDGYQATMRKILQLPLEPIDHNVSVRTRAEMIARTETARAHTTGTLQAYANYGINDVEVITVKDKLVCDWCLDLEVNNPHPINSPDLPPVHPNCRCSVAAHLETAGDMPLQDNPTVINLIP